MDKPTSGEWVIKENHSALIPEVSVLNDRGYKIAGVGRIADARLIVSAPAMLTLLEEAADSDCRCLEDFSGPCLACKSRGLLSRIGAKS